MTEPSATGAATAPSGHYDKGPVSISWQVQGDHNSAVRVDVELEGQLVASNTLSPGDANWNTGRHEGSNGWCDAEFRLQVPTRGQEGQLQIVTLSWNEGGAGGDNTTTNQLLGAWPYAA
jgi:hypothetical protein